MSGEALKDDLDPAAFVKRIRELSERHEREDAERLSSIEADIEKGRSERAARRAGNSLLFDARVLERLLIVVVQRGRVPSAQTNNPPQFLPPRNRSTSKASRLWTAPRRLQISTPPSTSP